MQLTVKVKKVVEEEKVYEVHDGINRDDTELWYVANIIANNCLSALDRDMYHDEDYVVRMAVEEINDAFKKAEEIMAFLKDDDAL